MNNIIIGCKSRITGDNDAFFRFLDSLYAPKQQAGLPEKKTGIPLMQLLVNDALEQTSISQQAMDHLTNVLDRELARAVHSGKLPGHWDVDSLRKALLLIEDLRVEDFSFQSESLRKIQQLLSSESN